MEEKRDVRAASTAEVKSMGVCVGQMRVGHSGFLVQG